jgi:hypothetical protein
MGHWVPVPPVQTPPWQASPLVHELPSSHGVPLGLFGFAGHEPPEQVAWL